MKTHYLFEVMISQSIINQNYAIFFIRVESEVRKLRSDLHVVRTIESELRGQIASLLSSERNLRSDLASLQVNSNKDFQII